MIERYETGEPDLAELRKAAECALDDLTASLTQVLKAVNKVHRAVSRLGQVVDPSTPVPARKDAPTGED